MLDKIGILLVVFFWLWGWIILWPISKVKFSYDSIKGLFYFLFSVAIGMSVFLATNNVATPHNTFGSLLSVFSQIDLIAKLVLTVGFVFAIGTSAWTLAKEKSTNKLAPHEYCIIYIIVGLIAAFVTLLLATAWPDILMIEAVPVISLFILTLTKSLAGFG